PEAARLLDEARAGFAAISGERSLDVAAVESALGSVARAGGDLDGAERHHRASLAIDRALRGEHHLDVARDLHNLAGVLRLRGDLTAALATYTEALRLEVALRGDTSVEAGLTHNSIGLVKMARADWAGARAELELAATALDAANHGDRAFAAHNLGLVHAAARDHRRALDAYARAAAIYATTIGPGALAPIRLHLDRARSLAALGDPTARLAATTAIAAAADRTHLAWIAADARALLAQLPAPARVSPGSPGTPPLAIDAPPPRRGDPPATGRPALTPPPPRRGDPPATGRPALTPPPPPPPSKNEGRDVGVYGTSLPR
ncbi:MAG: tetratricopeptide repeat protein, partial [Deltaproteobacteria bacterium]|nr:tetratricopeptide repeat protein [Deltaproteobacteria bacterium]